MNSLFEDQSFRRMDNDNNNNNLSNNQDDRKQRRTIISKSNSCALLAILVWITLLHVSGLYLFTRGFFLTRYEIPLKSDCNASPSPFFPSTPPSTPTTNSTQTIHYTASTSCWYPQRFKKAVIIVIDALRYDYLFQYQENSTTGENNNAEGRPQIEWYNRNRVPIVHELLEKKPMHSLLFKFRADPPTVTMQVNQYLLSITIQWFFILDYSLRFLLFYNYYFIHNSLLLFVCLFAIVVNRD